VTTWPLQELARLKLELREAVGREAYEVAATLRDKIRDLEHEITKRPRRHPRLRHSGATTEGDDEPR